MISRYVLMLGIVAAIEVIMPIRGSADTVFSNLVQPGGQYGPDALAIGHTPAFLGNGYTYGATRFTPSSTSLLDSIRAPLGYEGTGPNQVFVYLMSDAAGLPGSVLEAFTVQNLPTGSFSLPLTTIPSLERPQLNAGTPYWIAATGGPDTFDAWAMTLFQGDPTDGWGHKDVVDGVDSGWNAGTGVRVGALEILGAPVPEPDSIVLVSVPLLLLAGHTARRRLQRNSPA